MARPSRGLFISFEGGEGGGKSTQIKLLIKWLKRSKLPVVVTLEPGGTPIGKMIRSVLLDPAIRNLSLRSELLLYEADRAQHIDEVVLPALQAGKIVVTDRYADSSTVYQGICRGLGVPWTEQLNRFATGGLVPDLAIVLDLPEKIGLARVRRRIREDLKLKGIRRRVKLDRLEREKSEFHRKVRNGFLKLARRYPKRIAVVDAARGQEEIHQEIQSLVLNRLKRRGQLSQWKKLSR